MLSRIRAMRRLGVTKVVSYDAHFDKVPIKRVKPSEIAQHALPPDGNV